MRWPWQKRPEPVELAPDEWFALLRIGTRITLPEVLALDPATLQALYRASVRLDVERAHLLASLINRGEEAVGEALREVDGGITHESDLTSVALQMARASMGKRVTA